MQFPPVFFNYLQLVAISLNTLQFLISSRNPLPFFSLTSGDFCSPSTSSASCDSFHYPRLLLSRTHSLSYLPPSLIHRECTYLPVFSHFRTLFCRAPYSSQSVIVIAPASLPRLHLPYSFTYHLAHPQVTLALLLKPRNSTRNIQGMHMSQSALRQNPGRIPSLRYVYILHSRYLHFLRRASPSDSYQWSYNNSHTTLLFARVHFACVPAIVRCHAQWTPETTYRRTTWGFCAYCLEHCVLPAKPRILHRTLSATNEIMHVYVLCAD